MGNAAGSTPADLIDLVGDTPKEWNFFQLARFVEARFAEHPRIGDALRPGDEVISFGQRPGLAFAATMIESFRTRDTDYPRPRLFVNFFGLFGPNGPLPLVLTEYAHDCNRQERDRVLTTFLDMFHHRMLSLYYRAWANNRQAVSFDRQDDPFGGYVASLIGLGLKSLRGRTSLSDIAKFYYSGHLACQTRHASGLAAILSSYFAIKTVVQEYQGEWIALPPGSECQLGASPGTGLLGQNCIAGSNVWTRQQSFRLRMGPMSLEDYERLLPGSDSLHRLLEWVSMYVGLELTWDVQLVLRKNDVPAICLGKCPGGRLGFTSWLGPEARESDADDLVIRPVA